MAFPEAVEIGGDVEREEYSEGSYPEIENFEERIREDEQAAPEFTLEGLLKAITKQPLHRHIYRKLLIFLNEEHSTEEAEAFLAEVPEFAYAVQPAGRFLDVLERAGGIERRSQDEDLVDGVDGEDERVGDIFPSDAEFSESNAEAEGVAALEEAGEFEETPQDALATLVGAHWLTTDLGREYIEATDPIAPLNELITQDTSRTDSYLLVLERCAREPQSLADLEKAIRAFQRENESAAQIQPSVYLDRLERVGGLYWKGQWNITKEGREILASLMADEAK